MRPRCTGIENRLKDQPAYVVRNPATKKRRLKVYLEQASYMAGVAPAETKPTLLGVVMKMKQQEQQQQQQQQEEEQQQQQQQQEEGEPRAGARRPTDDPYSVRPVLEYPVGTIDEEREEGRVGATRVDE